MYASVAIRDVERADFSSDLFAEIERRAPVGGRAPSRIYGRAELRVHAVARCRGYRIGEFHRRCDLLLLSDADAVEATESELPDFRRQSFGVCSSVKQVGAIAAIAFDPLLHNVVLPLQATFYPIGFPVQIHTNDPAILTAAEESWSGHGQRFLTPPLQVRIAVSNDIPDEIPQAPVFRAQGHLLAIVSDAANFAMCDFSTGFAFCWLTPRAAAARAWVRHFFLEAIAYATLTHLYVTAVHAACITKNGLGVLLCGESGIGKSVLALKCARNGWTFVTDDVSYLLRAAENGTVLGKPKRMKFLPSAASLFPDIEWTNSGADHDGEPFAELRTGQIGISTEQSCTAGYLIFLRRPTGGPAHVMPIDSNQAFARLVAELPVYEKSVYAEHLRSIEVLSRVRAFDLHYDDLDDAVRLLDDLTGM